MERPSVSMRRWRRRAAVAAAVVAMYAALGFLAAPRILRGVLVERASIALRRDVAISRVRVNPFTLSVTVEGLAVSHRSGAPFVAWESLYVRLSPLRLVTGDVPLGEIRLVRPTVHVGLGEDGALTFQDLLTPAAAPEKPPTPAKGGSGMAVYIGRLAVEEARVLFRDETRHPAFATTLGPLTIRLESFRSTGGGDSPYSFAATTDSGETLRWSGTVRSEPLRSRGTLAFERITLPKYGAYLTDDVLPADLRDGLLDLEIRYELEWSAAHRVLRFAEGKLRVDRLAVAPHQIVDPPIALPRIEASGIAADALARSVRVEEVSIRGGTLRVRREADGRLELLRMVPAPSRKPEPAARTEPWTWLVGRIAVADVTLRWEDLTTPRPVLLPLTRLEVVLEPLRDAPDAVAQLSASAAWGEAGRISIAGPVRPLGSAATLELAVTDLDVTPLGPYLEREAAIALAGGRLGAKAKASFDGWGRVPRWSFEGDVRLDALGLTEPGNEELLRWQALEVTGIDVGSTPPHASVRLVRLAGPRVKVYVWEDGQTSVSRARRTPPGTPAPAVEARAAPAGPVWRTSLGAIRVEGGRATIVDRSVSPPAVVRLTRADAKVARLSTDAKVRSALEIALEIEGSPVRISGALDALRRDAFTDLTIESRGVDLTPLGPYGGKYLGYGIEKGKLDLDLRVHVQDRYLAGTNVVRVDQFTLGEKTDSPDATAVPIRLALALLQDSDGVILLDVPVEGNLDDPEFRLGKVIWRAILNVLVKLTTSPFRALAALAGGGETDLSTAEFVPGTAEPVPAARERFQLLARSLAKRPRLGLELEAAVDPELDGTALRRAAVERSLRRAKGGTLRVVGDAVGEILLAPEERARLVRAAYDAKFPAPAPRPGEAVPPPPTVEAMEDRLAAAVTLPPDALRALASERAQRAREELVAAGIDPARIFLAEGAAAGKEKAPRVYFAVR